MERKCKYCGNSLKGYRKRRKYCSRNCYLKDRQENTEINKIKVKCGYCGKLIERYPSQILEKVYCSKECYKQYSKEYHSISTKCDICGKPITRNKSHYKSNKYNYCSYECSNKGWSKFYTGKDNPNFLNSYTNCSYCNKKIYRKQCRINAGKNFFCSLKCETSWQSENIRGANHPNYNPNITDEEREIQRNYPEYREWRKLVYERDDYTCQICGDGKGGNLNAHHLNGYNWDKENRTNIYNAITLCEKCHIGFHTKYGTGNNTKEQFKEYIKNI